MRELLDGLARVAHLMDLTHFREKGYLARSVEDDKPELVKALVKLYAELFKFQGLAMHHLHKGPLIRGIQDTLKLKDWKSQLNEVETRNTECEEYIKVADAGESRDFHEKTVDQLGQINSERNSRWSEKDRNELLQTLASTSADWKAGKDANPERVEGTCEWLLNDEKFRQWRDAECCSLMWIFAEPGCGKSVLSKYVIDEKRLIHNAVPSCVSYFFFKDGQENRRDAESALSALLHQILTQPMGCFGQNVVDHAVSIHKEFGQSLRHKFSELWDLLIHAAQSFSDGQFICVLDALDECEEAASKTLMKSIRTFYSAQESDDRKACKLKFFVTSRPYQDQRSLFRDLGNNMNHVYVDRDSDSDTLSKEIKLVIDDRVSNLYSDDFSDDSRDKIKSRLGLINSRNLLWIDLAIDNIKACCDHDIARERNLDDALLNLSDDPFDEYEKMLNRGKGKNAVETRILLQIVVAAQRPLEVEEASIALWMALEMENDPSSCTSLEQINPWPTEDFRRLVRRLCGLVVSVSQPTLTLIHQTAREFLVNQDRDKRGKWQGAVDVAEAHAVLSQVCTRYLSLKDLPCTDPSMSMEETEALLTSVEEQPLFEYASQYWGLHYNNQGSGHREKYLRNIIPLCEDRCTWFRHYIFNEYDISSDIMEDDLISEWTSIGIASFFGLDTVVENALAQGIDVNAHVGPKRLSALHLASYASRQNVVDLLLRHESIDLNLLSHEGTALSMAARRGNTSIVATLLEHSADPNRSGDESDPPLVSAAKWGNTSIVKMLLDAEADVNLKSHGSHSALDIASADRNAEMFKVLMTKEHCPSVEEYRSALRAALGADDKDLWLEALVRSSVIYGAGEPRVALWNASYAGQEQDVLEAIERNTGQDIEVFHVAQGIAAVRGHTEVLLALLKHAKPPVNMLNAAVIAGREVAVKNLLKHVEPDEHTWELAVDSGEGVLQCLLQHEEPGQRMICDLLMKSRYSINRDPLKVLLQHMEPSSDAIGRVNVMMENTSAKSYIKNLLEHVNHNVDWGFELLVHEDGNPDAVEVLLETVSFNVDQLLKAANMIDEQAKDDSITFGYTDEWVEKADLVRKKVAELQREPTQDQSVATLSPSQETTKSQPQRQKS